jgi:hypothetical protein
MIREMRNLAYHSNDGKFLAYPIKEGHNGY